MLLRRVYALLKEKGFRLVNADITIIAQQPKMRQYIDRMCENVSADLETEKENVSIKATTTEKLGFEGRGEGIAAMAVVLIDKI